MVTTYPISAYRRLRPDAPARPSVAEWRTGADGHTAVQRAMQLPKRRPRTLEHDFDSSVLGRRVRISILLPPYYRVNVFRRYPLTIFNDGQDFPALGLVERLARAYAAGAVLPRIVVGVHADERRMREYGTSQVADYAGRGDLAAEHRRFLTTELMPWLRREFRVARRRQHISIAGFSMGGLSAFDVAWQHAHTFGAVACFSPSFWWRSAPFREDAPDADRIVVDMLRHAASAPELAYYFAAGTAEEESDRNGNGVVDVVDDVQDVVAGLRRLGVAEHDLRFDLVEGGRHDQQSWGPQVMSWLAWLDRR